MTDQTDVFKDKKHKSTSQTSKLMQIVLLLHLSAVTCTLNLFYGAFE